MNTMLSHPFLASIIAFFVLPAFALASSAIGIDTHTMKGSAELERFEHMMTVRPEVTLPTLVSIEVPQPKDISIFAVHEVESNTIVPTLFTTEMGPQATPVLRPLSHTGNLRTLSGIDTFTLLSMAYDGDRNSGIEFGVEVGTPVHSASLSFAAPQGLTARALTVLVMPSGVSPDTVSITVDGRVVLAQYPFPVGSGMISFPQINGTNWSVSFTYRQPLLISEISLVDAFPVPSAVTPVISFLAQPGQSYRIFMNPDATPLVNPGQEFPQITSTQVAKRVTGSVPHANLYFVPSDDDLDGLSNRRDNCPRVANPLQEDVNLNRVGDICEDVDFDGTMGNIDNCPHITNSSQRDSDGDGIGDACDTQENRFTEAYPFVPWVGMGIALCVILGLLFYSHKHPLLPKENNEGVPPVV
jgi:hypothetical protein